MQFVQCCNSGDIPAFPFYQNVKVHTTATNLTLIQFFVIIRFLALRFSGIVITKTKSQEPDDNDAKLN